VSRVGAPVKFATTQEEHHEYHLKGGYKGQDLFPYPIRKRCTTDRLFSETDRQNDLQQPHWRRTY
jgi:hypothetical protein